MTTCKIIICILLFPGTCYFITCTNKTTGPEPTNPNQLEFVTKSLDNAYKEKGVDAIPDGNGIMLQWQPINADLVEWIKIYKKSQAEQKFIFLTSVEGSDTNYVDYDVNLETRYYYFLKSVDQNKVESLPSDTVDYKLLPKAGNLIQTALPIPTFSWQYPYLSPVGYLIRVEDGESAETIWISSTIQSYELVTMKKYNFDGRATLDSLATDSQYRWRVDVLGSDLFSGSESSWKIIEND